MPCNLPPGPTLSPAPTLPLARDRWTTLAVSTTFNLYIWSAYYAADDHKLVVLTYASLRRPTNVTCLVQLDQSTGLTQLHTVTSQPQKIHAKKIKYTTTLIECFLKNMDDSNVIKSVVIFSHTSQTYSQPVQVQFPAHPGKPVHNFTVCVQPVYDYGSSSFHTRQFLEFMETSIVFGASLFVIYLLPGELTFHKILREYQNEGLIELFNYTLPRSHYPIPQKGQTLSITDCLYRHMWDSKYIATFDFDEILVPMQQNSWMEFMDYLQQKYTPERSSFGELSFRNIFFHLDECGTLEWLDLNNSNTTALANPTGYTSHRLRCTVRDQLAYPPLLRSKYIANPQNIRAPGIHYVWEYRNLTNPNCQQVIIEEREGLLFHYRLRTPRREYNTEYVKDTRLNQLVPQIEKRVYTRLVTLQHRLGQGIPDL